MNVDLIFYWVGVSVCLSYGLIFSSWLFVKALYRVLDIFRLTILFILFHSYRKKFKLYIQENGEPFEKWWITDLKPLAKESRLYYKWYRRIFHFKETCLNWKRSVETSKHIYALHIIEDNRRRSEEFIKKMQEEEEKNEED